MAWTVVYTSDNTSKAVRHLKLTADAATQTVDTGLEHIKHYTLGIGSIATIVGIEISINSNASGVSTPGSIGFTGFTSGDDLYVTAYGR